jgi:hypothetical protein
VLAIFDPLKATKPSEVIIPVASAPLAALIRYVSCFEVKDLVNFSTYRKV